MNNELKARKWYQKKRYLIPLGIVGLVMVLSSQDNSSTTISDTQKLVPYAQQATPTKYVPVSERSINQTPATTNTTRDNYYTNVDGNTIHSPAYYNSAPVGASAKCRDGTYSFSQHRSGTCSHHGGVAQWL